MQRAKAMGEHVCRELKLTEEDLKRLKELLELGVPKKRTAEFLEVS